nr:PspC domain-containing protein [uncultured Oscillibacter sp.]
MYKRLYKISEGKMVDGVCGGIAEYFGLDPTLVRLGWVIFSAMGGSGILAYIICAVIMPRE